MKGFNGVKLVRGNKQTKMKEGGLNPSPKKYYWQWFMFQEISSTLALFGFLILLSCVLFMPSVNLQ
jgi:hypothetical protein